MMQLFKFSLTPLPIHRISYYRTFLQNEHHIQRYSTQYILLFVLENTLFFEEDGNAVQVHAGEWYIQRANCMQTGKRASPFVHYFFIHFDAAVLPLEPGDIQSMGSHQELDKSHYLLLPVRGRLDLCWCPIFDKLQRLRISPDSALETQACFMQILHAVYQSTLQVPSVEEHLCEQVLQFLIDQFPNRVTAKLMEKHFHYTYDYIGRIFRQKYVYAPIAYYRNMKIQKAQELLTYTNMSLQQISDALDFDSELSFYKTFKNQMGEAPSAWRKKLLAHDSQRATTRHQNDLRTDTGGPHQK